MYSWLDTAPGFAKAAEYCEKNYPDGPLHGHQGLPAVFTDICSYDFDLQSTTSAAQNAYVDKRYMESPIYDLSGSKDGVINKDIRQSKHLFLTQESTAGAYTCLELEFARYVHDISCDQFSLSGQDCTVMQRHVLAYGQNDHFEQTRAPQGRGVKGHADDSVFINGVWQRNDPKRHVVGLLWLSNGGSESEKFNSFTGGELIMPFITEDGINPLRITPKFGQFCIFPASPMYLHSVSPVKTGLRITMTTWWTFNRYRDNA